MEEERVIPETHTFDGDVIALRDWAQDTAEHYEIPAGGVAVAYNGRAQLSVTDWNDPALPTQRTPWINEGDTVTFDEKTRFGVRPAPVRQDQLHLDGLTQKWDAGYDRDDWNDLDDIAARGYSPDLADLERSIANHPAGKAQRLADATGPVQATRTFGRN